MAMMASWNRYRSFPRPSEPNEKYMPWPEDPAWPDSAARRAGCSENLDSGIATKYTYQYIVVGLASDLLLWFV